MVDVDKRAHASASDEANFMATETVRWSFFAVSEKGQIQVPWIPLDFERPTVHTKAARIYGTGIRMVDVSCKQETANRKNEKMMARKREMR